MNRFRGGMARLVERFARSQKGNVAMMAGIALPVLLMVSAGAIDLHNAAKVKSELQDALDAATLAAARSSTTNPSEIQNIGMASLRANMPQYFAEDGADVAEFVLDTRYKVQATATVQVKTIVANVFLPPYGKLFDDYLPMSAGSEVLRASRNVEVALALDVTGSMATPTNYMPSLIDAAKELVGIVIQGDQDLFTTKVALIPYAAGVNMGTETRAAALRGSITGGTDITNIVRYSGATTVTNVNNRSKEITLTGHGLQTGDKVYLTGFKNDSGVNNTIRAVTRVNDDRFIIDGTSNRDLGSTLGTIYKCIQKKTCETVVTSANHGLSSGERVHITGAPSSAELNTPAPNLTRNGSIDSYNYRTVTVIDSNTFAVDTGSVTPPTASWSSSNPGRNSPKVFCGRDRCSMRIFTNKNNKLWSLDGSTCVSERVRGSAAPSDRPVGGTNYLGRAYINNTCPSSPFAPLNNDLPTVNAAIEGLTAGGSTAGQVGVEMAWYAISPNFGAINGVTPRPFNSQETVKAVVIMTDGEFNIPFCQGVIAQDALDEGSGSNNDKINCDASNGDAFNQAYQTCLAMKRQGIVVYSVAFNMKTAVVRGAVDTAYEVMYMCATDPDENFFAVSDGTNLKEAFKQIGRDITRLRIAR